MPDPQDWFSANAPTAAPPSGNWFASNAPTPDFKQTDTSPNEVDPNTVGTFASHVWTQINPIAAFNTIAQAITPKAIGGKVGPVDAIKGIGKAQGALYDKAKASYEKGDYLTAARHFVDYLIPLVGPALDKSSDLFQAGHWAAGGGDALGIGLALFGPKAISEHLQTMAASKPAQAVADAAERKATQNVVDVIAPKVGPNKLNFGKMAVKVAPTVARETTGLTRSGIADSIAAKLDEATTALDEAGSARLNARTFSTAPVLKGLLAKRAELTSQAVEGSEFTPQSGVNRPPLGADVVPGPNSARVAMIDQAISEVKQLGAVARYEALRRIRQAYDGPAKAVYSPAVTTDFLKAQGGKLGAADVTGVIRDHLATLDPETASANAQYSLWKKASDVITAAEEVDRVRPTVGRTLMARGLGAGAGGGINGGFGAAIGAVIGPLVERTASSLAPALKMVVARNLTTLSDALHAGDVGRVKATLSNLQKMAPVIAGASTARAVQPVALPLAAQGQQP